MNRIGRTARRIYDLLSRVSPLERRLVLRAVRILLGDRPGLRRARDGDARGPGRGTR